MEAKSILMEPHANNRNNRINRSHRRTVSKASANVVKAYNISSTITNPTGNSSNLTLIVDSGATHHILGSVPSGNCRLRPNTTMIQTASGTIQCHHEGSFGPLKNFLLVPEISENLLSVSKKVNEGYTVVFSRTGVNFYKDDLTTALMPITPSLHGDYNKEEGLFILNLNQSQALYTGPVAHHCRAFISRPEVESPELYSYAMLTSIPHPNSYTLWHNRLGHQCDTILDAMSQHGIVNGGITYTKKQRLEHKSSGICQSCAEGKFHSAPMQRWKKQQRNQP